MTALVLFIMSLDVCRVCFFVLCKRHRFNKVPGAHRGDSLRLPLALTRLNAGKVKVKVVWASLSISLNCIAMGITVLLNSSSFNSNISSSVCLVSSHWFFVAVTSNATKKLMFSHLIRVKNGEPGSKNNMFRILILGHKGLRP